METNIMVILGIALRIYSILVLLCIIPLQIKEIRDNTTDWPLLKLFRWVLLLMSMLYIILCILPLTYSSTRINTPPDLTLQNLSTLSNGLGNAGMITLFGVLYLLTGLSKRYNSRK